MPKIQFMTHLRWRVAQRFENWWWQNFTRSKEPQQYRQSKIQYWRDFLGALQINPDELAEPMIDIGCGPAGIFTLFQDGNITALDPLLDAYQNKLAIFDRSLYPQVHFIAQPFEDLPLERPYPTVFCLNAINHFRDLESSFKKLSVLTEPGGTLVFSIDCHNHRLLKPLYRRLQFDVLHPHQYDLAEYCAMLEAQGFTVLRTHRFIKRFTFDYIGLVARKNK